MGKVWSLVVVPPDDTGHRREERRRHRGEDVARVSVEGREGVVTSNMSVFTADFIRPFVKLQKIKTVFEYVRVKQHQYLRLC